MIDKTFKPAEAEARIYKTWESAGAFACGRDPNAKPYTIVIPPPNVTGSLHMGHALNNTLQDILVRFERMRGRDVLWQPGTDHAGIATQMVVERQLGLEQKKRQDLGRDAFLKRVWDWKAESGGVIINQLRRLGCSCDWSRERFTMDEGLSRAVTKVFVALYRDGLIYKDKRLVNWDPKFRTAISDLEVVSKEIKGHLWHIRYPLADKKFDPDDPSTFVTVATTRPETMLGDTAVAIHPEHPTLATFVGKEVLLPLANRRIPVIGDEYADPEKGTGAVKITPAHDFNDFEVGRRHGLPMINILDADAKITGDVPEAYRGLDRFVARKQIVADLDAQGLLVKIEPHVHAVPHGDRSDEVVEPWLTDQWYVKTADLAKRAVEAVERGETVFVPRNWEKTYFQWMRNIEPWCISRQLWWGHQIPAWYHIRHAELADLNPSDAAQLDAMRMDLHPFAVADSEGQAAIEIQERFPGLSVEIVSGPSQAAELWLQKKAVGIWRDEDVLDTWFSSQLWPFSTLGWPEQTPELKRYYPTDVLITGFDIIFFWVARMMMAGLHFMGEVPFKTVYIHALVRDEKGAKMSKSKGNVMDPLGLIDEFGADALRFTLAAMAAQGRDIKLSKPRIEGYRNFTTKLWNAARFCEMNECRPVADFAPASVTQTVNRWILGETAKTQRAVTEALDAFRFNEAAGALYQFVWGVYCDWYLEFIKPLFLGEDQAAAKETRATAAFVLDEILKLLHPFMPFVTEELWQREERSELLILSQWPKGDLPVAQDAMEEMNWVVRLIGSVRSVRAEMNVPAAAQIPLVIGDTSPQTQGRLKRHQDLIVRLARLSSVATGPVPAGAVQLVLGEATLALALQGIIDIAKEHARLEKEVDSLGNEIAKIAAKLGDASFVSRAPEEIVEENRERLAEMTEKRARLSDAAARLKSAN